MMSRTGFFALFVLFLLAALAAFLPLRAITEMTGAGRDAAVFGTVWNGHVQGLVAGPRRLGDIAVALRPAGLVSGRAEFDWSIDDPALGGTGQASAGAGGYRITDARLVMTPAAFVTLPGGLLSPQDAASLVVDRIVWRDGGCAEAAGRVRSDALYAMGQRLGADLPALDGTLTCRGGDLVAEMNGQSADATVSAEIRLNADGVSGLARVETGSRDAAAMLQAGGFVLSDGVWTLEWSGE